METHKTHYNDSCQIRSSHGKKMLIEGATLLSSVQTII